MKQIILISSLLVIFLSGGTGTAKADEASGLSLRQKSIIPIASSAAAGDMEKLKDSLNEGLDNGLTVNEIKEILIQVYAYAGFPRSLNAINTFMNVMKERGEKRIGDTMGPEGQALSPDTDKFKYGEKVQTELMGRPNTAAYQDFAPAIGVFLKEHLFADIFARGVLTYQEREIATVSMLAVITGVQAQLRGHLNVAMNTGLSEAQINAIINVLKERAGKTAGNNAAAEFKAVLKNRNP